MRKLRMAGPLAVFVVLMLLTGGILACGRSVPVVEAVIPMQTGEVWKLSDDELGWELSLAYDHFTAQQFPDQWMWAVIDCWSPALHRDADEWAGFGMIDAKCPSCGVNQSRGSYGVGNRLKWGDIVRIQFRDQSGLRGEHIVQLGSVS